MADARTEVEKEAEGRAGELAQGPNAVSATGDASAQGDSPVTGDASAAEAPSSSEPVASSGVLGSRFGKVGLVAIAVVLAVLVLMFAGAGSLNVGVSSSSGANEGALAEVALYKGDVTAVLGDDDPANDPEPLEVNRVEVGQRTSFSVKELGEHTVQATLVDAPEGSVKSTPATVNMFGIDSFAEVVVS